MHQEISSDDGRVLHSPNDMPHRLTVEVRPGSPGAVGPREFRIEGSTGQKRYLLRAREHDAYLDLFAEVARDFGTRVPANRSPRPVPGEGADYSVLLADNIDPKILYGYGDPAALRVEVEGRSVYFVVATSNDAPDSFPIIRSDDLRRWTLEGFVFPEGSKPAWAADGEGVGDFWAPELHRVGERFVLYFVARERSTRSLAIGIASSDDPSGPFLPQPAPLLTGGVIDPHVLVDVDGIPYLYWKEDNNDVWPSELNELLFWYPHLVTELFPEDRDQRTVALVSALWPWLETLEPMERFFVQQLLVEAVIPRFKEFKEQLRGIGARSDRHVQENIESTLRVMVTPFFASKLSPDGFELVGDPVKVLENDSTWEAHVIEGMWVSRHDGRYYMVYAGNDFSTAEYGIGVAVGDSPLGPFEKMPEPFLRSSREWWAPGHPSIVEGPDGNPLMLLHAFPPGEAGYKRLRALLALPIAFGRDGVGIRSS